MHDVNKALSCWALANSYSLAANRLTKESIGEIYLPTVFLLGHSVELHLKAFLISRGVPEKRLRKIGHDLIACLKEAKCHGLDQYISFSSSQVRLLARINLYYQEKKLEYFADESKRFGSIEEFELLTKKISLAVFGPLTEEILDAQKSSTQQS